MLLVGKYMSTKIWEFLMNCHLCGNKITCRTDPENTDYKFVSGAHKIVSIFVLKAPIYLNLVQNGGRNRC